jgi:hypothetical protein
MYGIKLNYRHIKFLFFCRAIRFSACVLVLFVSLTIQSFGQTQVKKIFFKTESSENNSVALSGVDINIYFRSGGDRYSEFKKKLKYLNFEGEVNFWCADSSLNKFSYVFQGINLGTHPVTLITDFEWNIDRVNNLFKEKKINIKLRQMTSLIPKRNVYEMIAIGSNCKASEEFDFFIQAVELTIRDLSEVYNGVERFGDLKYTGIDEFRNYKIHTDSLIKTLRSDFNDSLLNLKSNSILRRFSENRSNVELNYSSNSFIPDVSYRLISGKINFSSSKNSNFYFSLGYSNIHKQWSPSVGEYSNLIKVVDAENYFDIAITGRDIQDRNDLNVHSFTLGFKCDGKLTFGLDFFIPVASELTSENISGVFNYMGINSDILEPLLDIPELGLQSNVSYKGQVQGYSNVMKPSVTFNLGMPIKMGERIKLKPSLNYILNRQFKNIQFNDELTQGIGSYSGLIQYSDYSNRPGSSFLFGIGLILVVN